MFQGIIIAEGPSYNFNLTFEKEHPVVLPCNHKFSENMFEYVVVYIKVIFNENSFLLSIQPVTTKYSLFIMLFF